MSIEQVGNVNPSARQPTPHRQGSPAVLRVLPTKDQTPVFDNGRTPALACDKAGQERPVQSDER